MSHFMKDETKVVLKLFFSRFSNGKTLIYNKNTLSWEKHSSMALHLMSKMRKYFADKKFFPMRWPKDPKFVRVNIFHSL